MSLRLLVIAPRYHPAIIGGSEHYLQNLVAGLERTGVEVTVLTTCSSTTGSEGSHALTWANDLDRDDVAGPGRIRRYPTYMLPRRLRTAATNWLERVRARAEFTTPIARATSHFGAGFYPVETWGDGNRFRWAAPRAVVELAGQAIQHARLELWSPRAGGVRITAGGRRITADLPAERWTEVVIEFAATDRARLELQSKHYRPPLDPRRLGVAVRSLVIRDASGERQIPIDADRAGLLAALPTDQQGLIHDRESRTFGPLDTMVDGLLKGPLCPGLVGRAIVAARRADAVLATNAPFLSLAYGLVAARSAGRPLALLPFFHLRDRNHHRPAIRGPLRRADRVLCLNRTMADFVGSAWQGHPAVIGGGIDAAELSAVGVSGDRFRAAHALTDVPLILTVCRKTPDKGYPLVVDAVRQLRRREIPARLVLIGPDEDRQPLDPDLVTYLGPQSRADVLDALDACDVFALPSRVESFGLVYLEAWMRGRPVVGHRDCAAAAELIEPGTDGELVVDAAELAEVLARLLANPTRRAALGAAGRTKTLSRYTWEAVAARCRATLDAMIAERGVSSGTDR